MATLKFDLIAQELMHLVKDNYVTPISPGTGLISGGTILRSREIISEYVNRAMLKVFNDIWFATGGNKKAFVRLIPELVDTRTMLMTKMGDNGEHVLASPNLDVYEMLEISTAGGLGVVGRKELVQAIERGNVLQYTGTISRPIGVFLNSKVRLFPYSYNAVITVIVQPINPKTGALLVQNGEYDSPFAMNWNGRIAKVAYGLYLEDSQTQS